MSYNLTSDPQAAGQPLYTSSATPYHMLGERLVTADGRVYRYAKCASGSALVAGNWIQSPAEVANHQNIAPTATFAIGSTEVTVQLGATAATLNQYAGGQMVVTITPGLGQQVVIESNPAADSAATLTLKLAEPLRVAVTTTTRVDLVPNQFNGVIQNPATTLTGTCVGVATYIIAASEYGWIQRGGLTGALISGTPGVGRLIVVPSGTAGAAKVDPADAADHPVGVMASTGGSGECNGVMLIGFE